MKLLNSLWDFFSSVKLAIFTLCTLALTSIIGTIIPQSESHAFYVDRYGAKMAQFFHILDIPNMYYSLWFLALLGLLSANLIICSLERFPTVWKIITTDNLAAKPEKVIRMGHNHQWFLSNDQFTSLDISQMMSNLGWKLGKRKVGQNELFFSQKNRWSRIGVYLVHLSIIVIFVGAIIGHLFGFKGSVMLPEMGTTNKIYSYKDSNAIDLGFAVRCDSFGIEFYLNGMPKEYRSSLTILENDREVLQKDIRVNSPLSYKGITFYQSSYQDYKDFIINIKNTKTGDSKQFILPFQEQKNWDDKNIRLGIINAEAIGKRVVRSKIWFKDGNNPATIEWVADNQSIDIVSGEDSYNVTVKQMYATGLQVSKDPGVWLVYIGCGLMLLGLYMAFFLSHKRIWLYLQTDSDKPVLHMAGSTNKNKQGFEKIFQDLKSQIDQVVQQ